MGSINPKIEESVDKYRKSQRIKTKHYKPHMGPSATTVSGGAIALLFYELAYTKKGEGPWIELEENPKLESGLIKYIQDNKELLPSS
ncbi:hypothetical protein ACFLZJ_01450 [Nanoarchaeota archaeon]